MDHYSGTQKKTDRLSEAESAKVIESVEKASNAWIAAFNSGDAASAANLYEADTQMIALPFGTFIGRESIQAFWEDIIAKGFTDVRYIEPKIDVVNNRTAIISSKWQMNKAFGVVTKEL